VAAAAALRAGAAALRVRAGTTGKPRRALPPVRKRTRAARGAGLRRAAPAERAPLLPRPFGFAGVTRSRESDKHARALLRARGAAAARCGTCCTAGAPAAQSTLGRGARQRPPHRLKRAARLLRCFAPLRCCTARRARRRARRPSGGCVPRGRSGADHPAAGRATARAANDAVAAPAAHWRAVRAACSVGGSRPCARGGVRAHAARTWAALGTARGPAWSLAPCA
jgi:hypothetical protein